MSSAPTQRRPGARKVQIGCINCPGCGVSAGSESLKKMGKSAVKRKGPSPAGPGKKKKAPETEVEPVLKIDTKNFCWICYRCCGSDKPVNTEKSSHYVKFLTRYLKLDVTEFLKDNAAGRELLFKSANDKDARVEVNLCSTCMIPVEAFCERYSQWELQRLQIDAAVYQLRKIMKQAEKVPSRVAEFQTNVLEGENGVGAEGKQLLDGFRREFYKKSLPKRHPVLKMDKIRTEEPPTTSPTVLVQNQIVRASTSNADTAPVPPPPVQVLNIGTELELTVRPNGSNKKDPKVPKIPSSRGKTVVVRKPGTEVDGGANVSAAGRKIVDSSTEKENPARRKVTPGNKTSSDSRKMHVVRVVPRAQPVVRKPADKEPEVVDLSSDDESQSEQQATVRNDPVPPPEPAAVQNGEMMDTSGTSESEGEQDLLSVPDENEGNSGDPTQVVTGLEEEAEGVEPPQAPVSITENSSPNVAELPSNPNIVRNNVSMTSGLPSEVIRESYSESVSSYNPPESEVIFGSPGVTTLPTRNSTVSESQPAPGPRNLVVPFDPSASIPSFVEGAQIVTLEEVTTTTTYTITTVRHEITSDGPDPSDPGQNVPEFVADQSLNGLIHGQPRYSAEHSGIPEERPRPSFQNAAGINQPSHYQYAENATSIVTLFDGEEEETQRVVSMSQEPPANVVIEEVYDDLLESVR